ncbi:MAG: hypothetical protein GEV05_27370 [Betaproteobacteria bacterium]|nr:hypothetical protein [Betaproteobacteria bacterium]
MVGTNSKPPLPSVLDGAIVRHSDGWRFKHQSGGSAPDARISDLTIAHNAPDFRPVWTSQGTFIEIPTRWAVNLPVPIPKETYAVIAELCDQVAFRVPERLAVKLDGGKHPIGPRALTSGFRVPIELWRLLMGDVIGAQWASFDHRRIVDEALAGWDAK